MNAKITMIQRALQTPQKYVEEPGRTIIDQIYINGFKKRAAVIEA